MGARRKKTKKRIRKPKKLPNWSLLALGLGIGVVLTVLIELFVYRVGSPGSGLSTLFSRAEKHASPVSEKGSSRPAPVTLPRPKFDFYTILPEIETVLPEKDTLAKRRTAKPATPEKDVSYVLQAASFANFEDADRLKAKLALNGLMTRIQKVTIEGKGEYHRVRLGPYNNLEELNAANQQLRELGINALRLKVKRQR